MDIKLLPEQVINQIAAGEVVERPVSVVKELVDNAIDSGTKSIRVSIIGGGQTLIEVVDQGCGMSKEDSLLAFERHATSKISSLKDLDTISTNGFRGEALSSISSVSSVTLRTKREESDVGTQVEIRGGKISNVTSVSVIKGTSIEVRNLFFNVPARKKFLKSQRVEEAKITELICAYGLAYWWIDFEYSSDGKTIITLPAAKDFISRAKKIIKGNTVEINYTFDDISVSGILGHPGNASSVGSSLTILVNKRFVHDRFVLRAVKEGFSSTLKEREFPIGVLEISMPGHLVDVNVHPQKSEVRFANSQKVFAAVKTAVEESVKDFKSISIFVDRSNTDYLNSNISSPTNTLNFSVAENLSSNYSIPASYFPIQNNSKFDFGNQSLSTQVTLENSNRKFEEVIANSNLAEYKFLGQIFKCYLLFELVQSEDDKKLVIVDMHAAHERINYNKLFNSFKTSKRVVQKLLLPVKVNLTPIELARFVDLSDYLKILGFDFSIQENSIEILEVPSILQKVNFESLIKQSVLDDDLSTFSIEESLAYRFARIACHASIRGGDIISREDSYALLDLILSSDFGSACPHGRPCIMQFSKLEVESWFGRDR